LFIQKNNHMKTQCCVCFKIKCGESWKPHPVAIQASHTYCPECTKKVREEIKILRESRKNV
jgi:hypothetical protein